MGSVVEFITEAKWSYLTVKEKTNAPSADHAESINSLPQGIEEPSDNTVALQHPVRTSNEKNTDGIFKNLLKVLDVPINFGIKPMNENQKAQEHNVPPTAVAGRMNMP